MVVSGLSQGTLKGFFVRYSKGAQMLDLDHQPKRKRLFKGVSIRRDMELPFYDAFGRNFQDFRRSRHPQRHM